MTGTPGQRPAGLLMASAWELRCTAGHSDKFYRVIVAGGIVIINFGRTGAAGSFTVHHEASAPAAQARARELTIQKQGRGYRFVREAITFPVAASIAGLAQSGGGTQEHTDVARDLVALFLQVSEHSKRSR